MEITRENVKIAVAVRTARAAVGWSQQELADKMAVAKSTIARIETVETIPKADFLTRAMRLFHEAGVLIDLFYAETLSVAVNPEALDEAIHRLEDEAMRRSDRKGKTGKVGPNGIRAPKRDRTHSG